MCTEVNGVRKIYNNCPLLRAQGVYMLYALSLSLSLSLTLALKFTPKNKTVTLQSQQDDFGLLIEVIDEGCGIDESVDLFAPFKRQGNKSGVGLGLFLAKSAADALGAKISIKNRTDGVEGTFASLQLNSKLSCIIPQYH